LTVTLGSNNVSLAVPASVAVPTGSTSALFNATAAASIASNQSAIVTATLGASSQTASINLVAPLVSGVVCNPTSLGPGAAGSCIVTLTQSAPTGGSTVTLGSNNASLTVPGSVTVSAGSTEAGFFATAAAAISSNQSATITATLGVSSQTATVNLVAAVLVSGVVCSPASLGQSAVSGCTVTLTQTAPAGGSTVTLASNNASLTVPASVIVAAGATTATFNATAAATIASNQSATVTATLGASAQTATISLLAPVLVSGVVCSPASLGQSAASGCTVTLTQTAPTGGSSVTLASNNASLTVPASVIVAAGATTATFNATAAATIASNQNATLTATLGASSQTATINLLAPVLVSGVVCSPTSLGQSAVSGCTVTLTQTAPAGGSTVTLASNNASLTVPASVTVAAGATTATFNATAAATIASNQSATVTATLGASSQAATINLLAPVLVSGVVCSPTSLGQSALSGCTVTLTQTAPAGGSTVTLASNNASLTVPASVIVAAGATTATFNATAGATIASNQSATVTATLGASSQTATINLLAPVLVSGVVCSPTSLGQSAVSTCTVTLTQTAPTGGSTVTLGSNNASLTVPASVIVAAGATTATFNATAAATIASNQSATVTATLGASSQTATINLLAPVLVSGVVCSPTSLGQSAVSGCTVTLTQTAPTGGSTVTLGSNNASLTVPASVTVAAGATTATFNATAAATIASNQSATVTATLGASSQTATINLLAPVLVSGVVCSPTSLGQSAVSTCTVTLTQTAPTGGSTLTLASNNASLTVPASVIVAAGATTATFNATAGATIASNQSATVTATLGASSQTATINLMAPVLVSGVVCSPTNLGQGAVSGCTATLTQTAPTGGSALTLASNNASLTVPASITVASGATTATFNATAAATLTTNQSATVTATLGASSQTATINLLAPVLVSGVVCSPTNLGQGAVSGCTATLTQTAPTGGSTLTLASNNASLTVPASITVASGATTATFNATAAATITTNLNATVTASLGASSQSASFSLVAPVLVSSLNCSPASLAPGGSGNCNLGLTQAPAISLVNVTSCGPQTFPTATCTIPATGSGHLIVVGWQAGGGVSPSLSIGSVTDNAGNSYTEAGAARAVDSAVGSVVDFWYAPNSTAGATTVTITPTALTTNGGAVIWEFAGADLSSPLDQTAVLSNQAATGTPSAPAVTIGSAGEAIISLAAVAGDVTGISSGNAFIGDSSIKGNGWAHLMASSAGTYAAKWNQVPAGTYAGSTVSFKAASRVTLTTNNPLLTIPASVTVAAGATSATFNATAAATIASNQSATVTASLGASAQTASISLVAPAPVLVSGLACNPTGVMSGATVSCAVTLSQIVSAPTSVSLSSNSALLLIPATVIVPAGSATANTVATAGAVLADTQAVVTASLGASSQNATVVLWSTPVLTSLACTPATIAIGAGAACTVTLSKAAGNLTVAISPNPALAAPATVPVPQGSSSAGFTVTAIGSAVHGAVLIASYNTVSQLFTFTVKSQASSTGSSPTPLKSLSCLPNRLRAGAHGICQIEMETTSDAGNLQLTSSSTSLRLPVSIAVRPGQSSARFRIDAVSPTDNNREAAATITARLGAGTAEESVSLDPLHGSLDVPGSVNAKFGVPIEFHVSASDSAATVSAHDLPAGADFDAASGIFRWVPGVGQQGSHSVSFTAIDSSGNSLTAQSIVDVDAGSPVVNRVINAASHSEEAACSPGAIGRLEGKWLTEGTSASDSTGQSTELSGTAVTVNGTAVRILSVSSSRVDFLCPAVPADAPLEITLQTPTAAAKPIQTVSRPAAPGIFSLDGSGRGQGIILHSGTTAMAMIPNYQYESRAAAPGESLTLYATGVDTTQAVAVIVGGTELNPVSVLADPALAGVYRIAFRLPSASVNGETEILLGNRLADGREYISNAVFAATEMSPE
jgi:hypothetical protein